MIRELVSVARWMFSELVMIGIALWTLLWFSGVLD